VSDVAHKSLRIAIRTDVYENGFAILSRKRFKVNQLTALLRSREQANHNSRMMSPYSRLYLFKQSSSDPAMPSPFERSAKPTELSRGLAKDLPIGSGEIESAHRYIAQQRLKLPGAWWRTAHADYKLALRITRKNGDWPPCWATLSRNGLTAANRNRPSVSRKSAA
jgi:hypothetical protein